MSAKLRNKLLIDKRVQGALLIRAVGYCLLNTVFLVAGFTLWQLYAGRSQPAELQARDFWAGFAPALLATLCAVPLVVVDCLRVTNRFAGPLYRMRVSMRKLARGEPVQPILFRQHDFWHEIAEEFNAAVARIERDKLAAAKGEPTAIVPPLYPLNID